MEYLKNKEPDLILLDILLPKENGIALLKRLKETREGFKIPVIAFSNYDEPRTKKEALELGVKGYLIKTQYTPQEMLEEVEKILKEKWNYWKVSFGNFSRALSINSLQMGPAITTPGSLDIEELSLFPAQTPATIDGV